MKGRSTAALVGALFLWGMLGLGCGGVIRSITDIARPVALSPWDIQKLYKMAVVRIDVYEWGRRKPTGGTGFIITPDGYILTCAHVLATQFERTRIKVVRLDIYGQEIRPALPATVIQVDKWERHFLEGKDIALLKISGHKLPTVKLGNAWSLEVGDPLVHIGYPEDSLDRQELVNGFVETIHSRYRESILPTLRTNLHFVPGHSGGPVFNFKGEVVAVAEAVLQKVNQPTQGYVIPINFFYPLLDRVGAKLSQFKARFQAFPQERLVWGIGLDDNHFKEFAPGGMMEGPVPVAYDVHRDFYSVFPQVLDNKGHTLITIRYNLKEKTKEDFLLVLDAAAGRGGDFSVSVVAQNKSNNSFYAGTYTFDAGAGEEMFPKRHELLVKKEWTSPGENLIVLKNDTLVNYERRIYWDYLALYRIPSPLSFASRTR